MCKQLNSIRGFFVIDETLSSVKHTSFFTEYEDAKAYAMSIVAECKKKGQLAYAVNIEVYDNDVWEAQSDCGINHILQNK